MGVLERARNPLFGRHGSLVVAVGCAYEVAALLPGSPLPTLTALSRRYPALRWAITGAAIHHFHLEQSVILEFSPQDSRVDLQEG